MVSIRVCRTRKRFEMAKPKLGAPHISSPRLITMRERRFWRLLNQMYDQGFEDRATAKSSYHSRSRKEAINDARLHLRKLKRIVFSDGPPA